jgi:hypothetical protein
VGWTGHVTHIEEKMNANGTLMEKAEGKRPLGRPRRRWNYIIKMDLIEVGWGVMYWIHLAQDRGQWRTLVKVVIKVTIK